MNNLTFYENLFQLRRKNSMTQKELSQILQVHITTVKKWEGGSCYPDAKNICALADIFHVTTDYLLGRASDEIISLDNLKPIERRQILHIVQAYMDSLINLETETKI